MKKLLAGVLSAAVVFSVSPGYSPAQSNCPAEVAQAKEMSSKARKMVSVKPEDIQAPRAMAGATSPARPTRTDITKPGSLVKQAESACKAGNTALAAEKAKAAMALLNP